MKKVLLSITLISFLAFSNLSALTNVPKLNTKKESFNKTKAKNWAVATGSFIIAVGGVIALGTIKKPRK